MASGSSKRNSLNVRLDNLLERSRTPSPDPNAMRRAASSVLRPSASASKLLYPQPAIDAAPSSPGPSSSSLPRPSTPRHEKTPSMSVQSSAAIEDEESRILREQTAKALQEAMATDVTQPSRHGGSSRSAAVHRPGHARPPPSLIGVPLRNQAPLLDLARQTTLVGSGASVAHLPPPPSDPQSDMLEYSPLKSSAPTLIRQNTPTRTTSVDALKVIQSRTMHTSAPSEARSSFAPGWWFQHKQEVEPLLEDRDKDDGVETAEDKLRKRYTAPKEACVLVHGLLGFDSVSVATIGISYWRGIKEALEAIGCEVLIAKVPSTSSIADRAAVLESIISKELPGRKVHLIGHSMGGLDSRYLVSHLQSDRFKPISVTTIATPHRGSPFATTFLEMLGHERMPQFLQFLDMLPNGGGDGKAFDSLTPEAMAKFNEQTPDAPDVQYFSFGASYNPGLIDTFKWPHGVILEKEGPNDGLVSVASSKWGKYVRTLENVNHMDTIGWVNAARFAWADFTGKSIKFKPATFYLEIVDMLAHEVEGYTKPNGLQDSANAQAADAESAEEPSATLEAPPAMPEPVKQQ